MPQIAAFPKCYMDELCITRSMSLFDWIEQAATLHVAGLELYPGFFTSLEPGYLAEVRAALERHHLHMPMLCASPDFTVADEAGRAAEIAMMHQMIDLVAFFDAPGVRTCRVLSGQRRPGLAEDEGVEIVAACISALLPHAAQRGVTLALENHYKDNYWTHPEFAQHLPVFLKLLDAVPSRGLGVNYDPSNALLAGDDPLQVLHAIKHRLVSMHASDRRLRAGATLADLRAQENSLGYASVLQHGEIGTGMIDYPAIMLVLREIGFDGWISIEDGVNGLDELRRSVAFVREMMAT